MSEPFENTYADQLNIETPEQVGLRFQVAGIGSRFLAYLTDTAIHVAAYLVLVLVIIFVVAALPRTALDKVNMNFAGKWFIAAIIISAFLVYWGYYALFEAFWRGQTPGKRVMKIRVIKDSGRRITLFEALARNLLRVVDYMPGFYLVGIISMVCTRENKRLGDLVAGTIVVHELSESQPMLHGSRTFTAPMLTSSPQPYELVAEQNASLLPADAVARLDHNDLNIIDTFFSRALDLDMDKRAGMAVTVANRMCAKMGIAPVEGVAPERLLEAVAYAMRAQGRG